MSIGITSATLVDASSDATGTATVTDPGNFHVHRFWVTFTAAASVQVQASTDGSTFVDLLSSAITTSGSISEVDRPWKNLRISWTGNTGDLTVSVEQIYSNPSGAV